MKIGHDAEDTVHFVHRLGLAQNPRYEIRFTRVPRSRACESSLPVVFGFVGKVKSRHTRLWTQQWRKIHDAKNSEDFVPLPTVRLDARQTYVIWGKHFNITSALISRFD